MEDSGGQATKLALMVQSRRRYLWSFFKERAYTKCPGTAIRVEPIALYHTKLLQKEPKIGGAWEWHQDYGYWYKNGFYFRTDAECYGRCYRSQ
ncbi:MAG: phytanoyl-CoA dioxygenase family protein [Chitinophagaceae bacterium]